MSVGLFCRVFILAVAAFLCSSCTQVEVNYPAGPGDDPWGMFVRIPAGSYWMGSPVEELGRSSNEVLHQVVVSRSFYLSRYEVTEQWWSDIIGDGSATSLRPKIYVTWDQAVAFCNALSEAEGLTPAYTILGENGDVIWDLDADGYRLPTETEWEYACRAGGAGAFANGPITALECDYDINLDSMGWYCGNTNEVRSEIGEEQFNGWGLADMHGNVWEWCWDGYFENYHLLPQVDPVWNANPGEDRVLRGGCWQSLAQRCRAARRYAYSPNAHYSGIGLRPARNAN